MRAPAPHDRILDLLRSLPEVDAQNRLLRLSDANLALSLIYMADWQQDYVLGFVGETKEQRVRLEVERQMRSRVLYKQYLQAADAVTATLEGSSGGGIRSYYRPGRPRPHRRT